MLAETSVETISPTENKSPAEVYLVGDGSKGESDINDGPSDISSIFFKIMAVLVFVILIFIGTYFAKVANGSIFGTFFGIVVAVWAFMLAPKIWRCGKR